MISITVLGTKSKRQFKEFIPFCVLMSARTNPAGIHAHRQSGNKQIGQQIPGISELTASITADKNTRIQTQTQASTQAVHTHQIITQQPQAKRMSQAKRRMTLAVKV